MFCTSPVNYKDPLCEDVVKGISVLEAKVVDLENKTRALSASIPEGLSHELYRLKSSFSKLAHENRLKSNEVERTKHVNSFDSKKDSVISSLNQKIESRIKEIALLIEKNVVSEECIKYQPVLDQIEQGFNDEQAKQISTINEIESLFKQKKDNKRVSSSHGSEMTFGLYQQSNLKHEEKLKGLSEEVENIVVSVQDRITFLTLLLENLESNRDPATQSTTINRSQDLVNQAFDFQEYFWNVQKDMNADYIYIQGKLNDIGNSSKIELKEAKSINSEMEQVLERTEELREKTAEQHKGLEWDSSHSELSVTEELGKLSQILNPHFQQYEQRKGQIMEWISKKREILAD